MWDMIIEVNCKLTGIEMERYLFIYLFIDFKSLQQMMESWGHGLQDTYKDQPISRDFYFSFY